MVSSRAICRHGNRQLVLKIIDTLEAYWSGIIRVESLSMDT